MRKLTIPALLCAVAFSGCKKEEAPAPAEKVVNEAPEQKPPTSDTKTVTVTSKAPGAIALLREGRSLAEGFRFADATTKFKKALDADPEFALAHAHLASLGKGEVSDGHRKRALELASKLPAAERLLVESMVAKAEEARSKALAELATLVPNDWQVQVRVAREALKKGKIDRAAAAFELAVRLNPKAAHPHNNLAYIYAEKGEFDKAVASVTKYAEMSPGEPNPLDSKGEMLLMAGKFAESEAAFQEALRLADDFAIAHEGIAATKFYRGDWAGGIAELKLATKKATRAIDRADLENKLAWALIAAGKKAEAKKAFSKAMASAREAGISKRTGAEDMVAAEVAMHDGDYKAARKSAEAAIVAMVADETPAKKQHWAQALATIAAARSGDLAAADERLAALKVAAKGSHYTALAETHVAIVKGQESVALAAAAELENNKWFSGRGQLLTAEAYEKAGKKDKAAKVRSDLANRYRRDIRSVILAKEAKKAGEG